MFIWYDLLAEKLVFATVAWSTVRQSTMSKVIMELKPANIQIGLLRILCEILVADLDEQAQSCCVGTTN